MTFAGPSERATPWALSVPLGSTYRVESESEPLVAPGPPGRSFVARTVKTAGAKVMSAAHGVARPAKTSVAENKLTQSFKVGPLLARNGS